ncbi:hypothetical protein LG296_19635 (plasmid) [Ureibacillus chungkukjangi]|uniref:hypothetical protein n=1 Tax=Ureibacillus chungkukjangi TaxID=1202712 RepID=UPI000D33DB46|nr:hypothetical protein [Ureibacillus chungkukjangi]MCM3390575.1 hypothetical protein [Ureibacillus chungkukjangi]
MVKIDPKIVEKISFFSNYFKDDILYQFIENHGMLDELLNPENEFLKSITLGEKYKNDDAAKLVGASSAQRVLNIINDSRGFKSYLKAVKVGAKTYIHDEIILFKLWMIFFLISKNFRPNEVAHTLGLVDATGVHTDVSRNNVQQIDEARILSIFHKEIYPFMEEFKNQQANILQNSTLHVKEQVKQELKDELIKEQELVNKKINFSIETIILTKDIEKGKEEISRLERQIDQLNNRSLRLTQEAKSYESKIEKVKSSGFIGKLLGNSNDSLKQELMDSCSKVLEEIETTSESIKGLTEELGKVKERVSKNTSELNMVLKQQESFDLTHSLLRTPLLSATISNVVELPEFNKNKSVTLSDTGLLEVAATVEEEKTKE